jgi:8-amino-7-oxononanoate synthase
MPHDTPTGRLTARLDALGRDGLTRRRQALEGPQGAHIRVDGRDYLAFCSNDYLGLANHPSIVQAAVDAVQRYGVGAGASHMVTGHSVLHERLEARLAQFTGLPRALLFSTGYQANIGAVTALAGRGDAVFSDERNHASLIDGTRLSRADVARYAHCDLAQLDALMSASSAPVKLVVTDGVFSMDGDIAPLPGLLALCERHDALLLVDDAHGFGVLGDRGMGVLAHFGIRSSRVVYVGTLGKAAGVSGAFVAGAGEIVETVLQRARTYMFTTASPAMLAAAVAASLDIIGDEEWRRERLRELVALLKRELRVGGGARLDASDTPIQPLIIGGNQQALAASAALRERGILVTAIRPPTVAEGTARLRIALSAAHQPDDVARLAAALNEILPA